MTDAKTYDRGGFARGRRLTIEPAANGTYVLRRHSAPPFEDNGDVMGFSSARHLVDFLTSEFWASDFKCPTPEATVEFTDPRDLS